MLTPTPLQTPLRSRTGRRSTSISSVTSGSGTPREMFLSLRKPAPARIILPASAPLRSAAERFRIHCHAPRRVLQRDRALRGEWNLCRQRLHPGIPVTVAKENSEAKGQLIFCDTSTVTCTNNVTSMVYGTSPGFFMLRTDVTNASVQPCASSTSELITYPCPTGKVTVTFDGLPPTDVGNPPGSTPGTYFLNSQGYAEDQFILISKGTFSMVASYTGDISYDANTSAPLPITITGRELLQPLVVCRPRPCLSRLPRLPLPGLRPPRMRRPRGFMASCPAS